MSDWAVAGLYILGVLHAVPAWYFGKASGLAMARRIMSRSVRDPESWHQTRAQDQPEQELADDFERNEHV